MRATTVSTLNCSRATRAAMMLELSPQDTAAKACASRILASSNVSRSNPIPVTCCPWNSAPSRRNALGSRSMTATECPARPSCRASDDPTRPQPMITMCTRVPFDDTARRGRATVA